MLSNCYVFGNFVTYTSNPAVNQPQNMLSRFRHIARKLLIVMIMIMTGNAVHAETSLRKVVVNLYGHLIQFNLQSDFYTAREKMLNDLGMQNTLNDLQKQTTADSLQKQLDEQALAFHMDDMAYILMVNKLTASVSKTNDPVFCTLFKYALLKQKGYDVILGKGEHSLTLYGRTAFNIQNCIYIERDGRKYYDLSFGNSKPGIEHEWETGFASTDKPIRINRFYPPSYHADIKRKTIPFEYDNNVYFFSSTINQSLVKYYNELPDIEINQVYLNYGLSEKGHNTLIDQLKDATAYMSTGQRVDFILSFVQSFEYAKDAETLGKEKFAFPEEALASDFTDCEDRSVLFAYLVREVLNLQTVGLFYKQAEHMNVAVQSWKKDNKGDFKAYGMEFIVCEPSGKGLQPGQHTIKTSSASVVRW